MRITGIQTLVIASFTMLMSLNSVAQSECPGWGTGQDSINNVEAYSLYREFYKQKNYKDAYHPWKVVFNNAPAARKSPFLDGIKILDALIDSETDEARKQIYLDTLFYVYKKRIECHGEEGYVKGRWATDMIKYKVGTAKEQMDLLSESVELEGNESKYYFMYPWFVKAYVNYQNGIIDKARALEIYLRAVEILSLNAEDEKLKDRVASQMEKMEQLLLKLEISCEEAKEIFGPKYEAAPDDEKMWGMIFELFRGSGCTEDPLFIEVTTKLYLANKTSSKAIFLARNSEENQQAINYFLEGIELEEDIERKAGYYMELATLYKTKVGDFPTSRKYANEAAKVKPNWGEPFLLIGDLYAASGKMCGKGKDTGFWAQTVTLVALDKYNYAKSIDSECHEKANKKIAFYTKYLPCKSDAFMVGINEGESITIDWCWINETSTLRTGPCN